ncbi:MAG: hypothetical protein ACKOW8_15815, partial [Flavobacteriales bacterium]
MIDQLDSIKRVWSPDRDERFAGFPSPQPRPKIVIGVNSVELARIAVHHADGLNVRASHPEVDEILAIADGRIESSVWVPFDSGLLDPDDERTRGWFAKGVRRVVAVLTG